MIWEETILVGWKLGEKRSKEVFWEALFVFPQLLFFVTFTILPFIIAIPIIFTDRSDFLDQTVKFVGMKNLVMIFSEPFFSDFWEALKRTVNFTILNYLMIYIIGLSLALIMFEYTTKLKRFFFTIIYMPYMISGIGAGMLLTMLFSKDSGNINLLLTTFGIISEPLDIQTKGVVRYALPFITGWRYAGVNLAFFLNGLLSIPHDTLEASVLDGANYFKKLIHIYLPQIIPSIVMASVTCLIGSFNMIDELFGLGATYGNQNAVFLSVLAFQKGFQGSMAQSVAMMLVVYTPLIIVAFLLIQWQKTQQY